MSWAPGQGAATYFLNMIAPISARRELVAALQLSRGTLHAPSARGPEGSGLASFREPDTRSDYATLAVSSCGPVYTLKGHRGQGHHCPLASLLRVTVRN